MKNVELPIAKEEWAAAPRVGEQLTEEAELWVKLTAPGAASPSGSADLSFLMLSTRSPVVAEYGGADAGKAAHYMVRWLSRRGEPGPWSETASATVGA